MEAANNATEARERLRTVTLDLMDLRDGDLKPSPGVFSAMIEALDSVDAHLKSKEFRGPIVNKGEYYEPTY